MRKLQNKRFKSNDFKNKHSLRGIYGDNLNYFYDNICQTVRNLLTFNMNELKEILFLNRIKGTRSCKTKTLQMMNRII